MPNQVDALPNKQPAIRVIAMPPDTNQYGDIFGGQPPGEGKRALHGVQQRPVERRAAALSRVKKDKIGVAPVRKADGFF